MTVILRDLLKVILKEFDKSSRYYYCSTTKEKLQTFLTETKNQEECREILGVSEDESVDDLIFIILDETYADQSRLNSKRMVEQVIKFANKYSINQSLIRELAYDAELPKEIRNEITERTKWVNPLEYVINFFSWFISLFTRLFTRNEEQNIAEGKSWVESVGNQNENQESILKNIE